jgi:hypothetical protein
MLVQQGPQDTGRVTLGVQGAVVRVERWLAGLPCGEDSGTAGQGAELGNFGGWVGEVTG